MIINKNWLFNVYQQEAGDDGSAGGGAATTGATDTRPEPGNERPRARAATW